MIMIINYETKMFFFVVLVLFFSDESLPQALITPLTRFTFCLITQVVTCPVSLWWPFTYSSHQAYPLETRQCYREIPCLLLY